MAINPHQRRGRHVHPVHPGRRRLAAATFALPTEDGRWLLLCAACRHQRTYPTSTEARRAAQAHRCIAITR
jgi:hypothetical protein